MNLFMQIDRFRRSKRAMRTLFFALSQLLNEFSLLNGCEKKIGEKLKDEEVLDEKKNRFGIIFIIIFHSVFNNRSPCCR
jgi:hypothetical protein